ncbi:MAG: outer membrane protein assembly factor BamD [Bacteroidia bacterium]|nr:outer membrane protein assembly factor BamD [Bacteroidia bacterium]
MSTRLVIFSLLICFTASTGCEYQKVLKKGTLEQKLDAARKYYNKGDYARSQILLEQLIGKFKRGANAEEVYFLYAYSHFGMNDYVMAGYHFRNFTERYPRSNYIEQAAFMVAKCEYHKTLSSELDQTNTKGAIEAIQLFINRYPKSESVEKGNELIDQLRARLHEKAYNTAILYYKMGDYLSAYTSFRNAVGNYPDLPDKEKVEYLIVRSAYLYAEQSIIKFQLERYEKALSEADEFSIAHQNSIYKEEVSKIAESCREAINRIQEEKKTSNN